MTPTLIETVLAFPLPVRLALLDAEPTGDGRLVWPSGYVSKPMERAELDATHRRIHVTSGYAWLPSNPLAVIEVAARILAARHGLTPSIELLGPDGADGEADWTCRLVVTSDIQVEAAGSREEIGVLVLREVCRG